MGGYPVMNAQLSAQIATGATVFPSGPTGGHAAAPAARPPGTGGFRAGPTASFELSGMQSDGETEPFEPVGPPGAPSGVASDHDRPPSSGPHAMHSSGPQAMPASYAHHESAAYNLDGMADPQRAASLMSPVGQYYPEQVNWAVAAATRARAVPPWLLGILFVAAIGIALALTVVIARAIR
jgi:hypothetical protein